MSEESEEEDRKTYPDSFFRKKPEKPSIIQCEHGYHHHAGAHACDFCVNDTCLYWTL